MRLTEKRSCSRSRNSVSFIKTRNEQVFPKQKQVFNAAKKSEKKCVQVNSFSFLICYLSILTGRILTFNLLPVTRSLTTLQNCLQRKFYKQKKTDFDIEKIECFEWLHWLFTIKIRFGPKVTFKQIEIHSRLLQWLRMHFIQLLIVRCTNYWHTIWFRAFERIKGENELNICGIGVYNEPIVFPLW